MALATLAVSIPAASFVTGDGTPVERAAATRPEPTETDRRHMLRETSLWAGRTAVNARRHSDRAPVELGTRFTTTRNGWATGVRFYKAAGDPGRHTGSLWSAGGRRLANVAFTAESASGWQEARFARPVRLKAGLVYTVSYHSDRGVYLGTAGFTSARSGPLATVSRGAGVFGYGASAFPRRWNPRGYNYWVDVVFRWRDGGSYPEPSPPPAPSPGRPTATSPGRPTATPTSGVTTSPSTGPSRPPTLTPGPSRPPTGTGTPSPGTTRTGGQTPPPSTLGPTRPVPGGCGGHHPTPECTGAPKSTRLAQRALNEEGAAYRVRTPGAVLDGVHIRGDLLIHADGVIVKNSLIDGHVINADGPRTFRFTIMDSTVGPESGCQTLPGVGQDKYTAVGLHVRGHSDGFRASGDDVVIRDSYVKLCSNPGDHSDGIQTYRTGRGLVFDHNTVDQRDVKHATAPIFLVDDQIVDAVVTNNLVMGGTYSIQLKNARGKLVMRGNSLVDKSWIYGPVEADCKAIDWAGNSLVTIDRSYRITSVVGPLKCA
ncbi:hypothetical protein FHS43_000356 [Streptosporangium becharense]|uniref:DUF4082 domain-containing protein n=1 Tax=Streptosporangium becharense TaxID=1816182 RepID=A0A7W9IG18_9ACTN|nr:DUF4082 domain-containing protein [Streptosporangium becharense]MBB2909110.1 hypothetical protein [Streptosporangium becharense]MBB5819871.1 hypothetical protein [Streptosporangium becharense]